MLDCHQRPLFQEIMEEETVSVWFPSTSLVYTAAVILSTVRPEWCPATCNPNSCYSQHWQSQDFPSCFEGEERFCRLLYTSDCLNKHFLWQCCDKHWASLHILGYIWLNITQTSGWFFFSPSRFILRQAGNFPYGPTELSYNIFPFFFSKGWQGKAERGHQVASPALTIHQIWL